jgi:exodeoxyribonuclease-1
MLAPMTTLSREAAARWSIDPHQVSEHAQRLRAAADEIAAKVRAVHARAESEETDPDLMLYSGGFFSDADRRAMDALHRLTPAELASALPAFEDPRLDVLFFRYRARNWPETLNADEREEWDLYRLDRLTDPQAGGGIVIGELEARLTAMSVEHAADPAKLAILQALADWAERVLDAGA